MHGRGRSWTMVDAAICCALALSGCGPAEETPPTSRYVVTDIPASTSDLPVYFTDSRDTSTEGSDLINRYYGFTWNESGREIIYKIVVDTNVSITATVGNGTSVNHDVFLLKAGPDGSLQLPITEAMGVLAGDDVKVSRTCTAGTYFLAADTYVSSTNVELAGPYSLTVEIDPI